MRVMARLATVLATLLVPVLLPALARAQAEPAPPATTAAAVTAKPLSDSLTGPAKTDYDVGKVLFRDGDFEGARVKFEAAYEKSKEPRLLFNIAACERSRNNYGRTIRLVKRYRKDADALLTDAEKKEADDVLAGLRPLVAPLTIVVNEAGAQVDVDGEPVGTSPLAEPVLVEFRHHRVRVAKEGLAERTDDVEVKDPTGSTASFRLEKPEARLVVVARPADTIDVDGKLVAMGRLEAMLPYGPHAVKVTSPGYISYQGDVVLQDKQPRTMNITLQKEKGSGLPLWAWIGGGVLIAAGATVGGYFLFRGDTSQPDGGISTERGTLGGVRVMGF
jgi:hypothetical protein